MEACLFCESDAESSALEPDMLFVCSRCKRLLYAQDDEKLQSAYATAVMKGKWRKVRAIKMVLDERNKL
jgi:hypothetical protein